MKKENVQLELPWFRTEQNYLYCGDIAETENLAPSLTVPDMSYTVRELLEKYTRGVPVNIAESGVWQDGEVTFDEMELNEIMYRPNPDFADLSEAKSYIKQLKEDLMRKLNEKKDANLQPFKNAAENLTQE